MSPPISREPTPAWVHPSRACMRRVLLGLAAFSISCSTLSRLTGASNPLTGRWREIGWVDCGSGLEAVPEDPIRELAFGVDGTVTVTWHPIETYVDYRGMYETSEPGAIKIVMTWSAYAPPDFDGEGTYQIADDGSLVLEDLWLGSPKQTQGLNGCGHRFEKVD